MSTEQNLFGDVTVGLDFTADVTIRISGKQIYNNLSGAKPWQVAIYWDGNLLNYAGGASAYSDVVFCEAAVLGASSGNHTLRLTWFGESAMQFRGVNCIVEWDYK
jgi:hypothetical protein